MTGRQSPRTDILAIGSCVLDISCTYDPAPDSTFPDQPAKASSNPAKITLCVGGVAHNMALAAKYAGASVSLCTIIADDDLGIVLLRKLKEEGLSTESVIKLSSSTLRTGTYVGNYDASKRLIFGMADVSLMKHPSNGHHQLWEPLMSEAAPKWVLLDTCFPPEVSSAIVHCARAVKAKVFVETVSVPRARSLMQWMDNPRRFSPNCLLDIVSTNELELDALQDGASASGFFESGEYKDFIEKLNVADMSRTMSQLSYPQDLWGVVSKAVSLLPYIPAILITLGTEGCVLAMLIPRDDKRLSNEAYAPHLITGKSSAPATVFIKHYPLETIVPDDAVVSVNGAGDSFKGALLARIVSDVINPDHEATLEDENHIHFAQKAAACSIRHANAVSPEIKHLAP